VSNGAVNLALECECAVPAGGCGHVCSSRAVFCEALQALVAGGDSGLLDWVSRVRMGGGPGSVGLVQEKVAVDNESTRGGVCQEECGLFSSGDGPDGDIEVSNGSDVDRDGLRGVGTVVSGPEVESVGGRGPNYARNRAAREKKKNKRRVAGFEGASSASVFSQCSEETQRELRESRARRYVAENQLAEERAVASRASLKRDDATRFGETKFELARQRTELKLRALQEKRLGVRDGGWAETVYSEGVAGVASVPLVSSGSVSPNSSISVAEEVKLRELCEVLTVRVKELELKLGAASAVKDAGVKYGVYADGYVDDGLGPVSVVSGSFDNGRDFPY